MHADDRSLAELTAKFSAFLGIPRPSRSAFPVGYLTPADVPERVAAFLTGQPLEVGGLPIVAYKAFRNVFTEKPRPPAAPSRGDFTAEAEQAYPPVPLDVLGEIDRLRALWIERRAGAAMAEHGIAVRRFEQREAKRLDIMGRYDKSEAGYVAFLIDRYPALARFLHSPVPVQVEEDSRRRHTYITGKSGCGKSELIKQFAHAYISGTAPQASIVIIDPHGELAEEIASLRDVPEDRLVYFEPAVDLSLFPVVNPFHSPHIERARSDEERKYLITHHAETIVEGMRAMLGADLTDNMETVLLHCICTILQVRDGSLLDLQEMVAPQKKPSDRQRHLIQVGRESLLANHRDFFAEAFFSDYYTSTRHSVYARLKTLTTNENFSRCLIGRNTIDLERALSTPSVLVFNLAKGRLKADPSRALGCLILASLLSAVYFRPWHAKGRLVPVHLFIDETQNFISDRINETLAESRKFGLHLTLAQQIIGQEMDTQLEEVVLGNTDVKITGPAGYKSDSKFARETGVSIEELQRLGKWQLFLAVGEALRVPLRTFDHLVGDRACLSPDEWQRRKARQVARYYRKADDEPLIARMAEADVLQWEL